MEEKEEWKWQWAMSQCATTFNQLLFVSNCFKQYSLLANCTTYEPRSFKIISLQFPRTILSTSCWTELQHIHFSCCNMFAKTGGSDINTRFYYVYIPLPWTCLFLLQYTSAFISCQVNYISCCKTIHYYISKA